VLVKPAQGRQIFHRSICIDTVGDANQGQCFRHQGAHHKNEKRVFAEYGKEATPGAVPVPEFNELNQGGQQHGSETGGIQCI